MGKEIKSGKQILDEFFNSLKENPDVNDDVANVLLELHLSNKLTTKNLANDLLKIREEGSK